MTIFDNRPKAHYNGDVRTAVGQVVGPNTAGEFVVIDEVVYDNDANKSTAYFRYATKNDFEK